MEPADRAAKLAAAARLGGAELELRAAQAALSSGRDDDAARERYRSALFELKAAEQAAQAALNGWGTWGAA